MAFRALTPFRRFGSNRDESLPTDPFYRLQTEMNRMFDDAFGGFDVGFSRAGGVTPSIDVKETDKEIRIAVELPGVDEKDVEVNLVDNVLTIRGEKRVERDEEEKSGYHVMERSYGSFARSIPLGFEVHEDAVEAVFENGVLTIAMPKPQEVEAKSKRIPISGG